MPDASSPPPPCSDRLRLELDILASELNDPRPAPAPSDEAAPPAPDPSDAPDA